MISTLRRLLTLIAVFFGVTFVIFVVVRLSPADPVTTMYPPEVLGRIDRERLHEHLGLNEPLPIQYLRMVSQFFNGTLLSFHEGQSTTALLVERLPTTLLVAGIALILSLVIGIPLATLSAIRAGSWLDIMTMAGVVTGLSLPSFWLGLVFILVFSERLRWLPASGLRPVDSAAFDLSAILPYLVLPVSVLTLSLLPWIVRFTRTGLMGVLQEDFVRTARSKGLMERRVILVHALTNALLPLVTFVGTVIPILLSGTAVVEMVFGLPGIGRLALQAAQNQDFPLLLTVNMYTTMLVLVISALLDVSLLYLDPRIRLE